MREYKGDKKKERGTLRLAEKGMSKDKDISHTVYVKTL